MQPHTEDDELREIAALMMGMKVREVIALVLTGEGTFVQTHDGQWTLIRASGAMEFKVDAPVEPEPEPAEPEIDPDAVPEKVADVLAWVGEDLDKAVRALEHEQGRDKPRTTLVAELEKLLQPAGDS